MSDTPIVTVDTPNDTEPTVNPSLTAEEKIAALEETNKKLYARTKTSEGFVQDSTGKWVKKEKPQATTEQPAVATKPSDILKSPEFRLHRQGYSEEEIEFIMHNGGTKALENEKSPVALGVRAMREQRLAEEAAGRTTDTSGQSEVERKYTPEQMRNMKPEELAKLIGYAP